MAAKTETKEAVPAAPAASAASASASRRGKGGWLPALAVLLAAPAGSWAVTQFVLMPSLEKKLLASVSAPGAAAAAPAAAEKSDSRSPAAPPTYEFQNVVVNLAGTMGTRYLKTTFLVSGSEPALRQIFEDHKAQLTDVTLNVLSSLTLADLEEPGSKNVLRERLVSAYNQNLNKKVAEQVYFSDFVVQ